MNGFSRIISAFLALSCAAVLVMSMAAVMAQQTPDNTRPPDNTRQTSGTPGTTPGTPPQGMSDQKMSGIVVSVDSATNSIRLRDEQGTTQTISCDSSTQIRSAGKSIGLSDIKAGDQIVATTKTDSSGKMIASSIEISKPGSTSGPSGTTDSMSGTTSTPTTTTTADRDRAGATTSGMPDTSATTSTTGITPTDRDRIGTARSPMTTDRDQTGTTTSMSTDTTGTTYAGNRGSSAAGDTLPSTATSLPLIATLGLLLVSAGAILKKIRD